jgi:hypothetical protein
MELLRRRSATSIVILILLVMCAAMSYILVFLTSYKKLELSNFFSRSIDTGISADATFEFYCFQKFAKKSHYDGLAVIVEFRSDIILITVVHNIIRHIPADWPVQIFHGPNNSDFIQNSTLWRYIRTGKVFLTKLPEFPGDRYVFQNTVYTNSSFWQLVRGEKILFFHADSVLCSNSPHEISDYFVYDWVGAPWTNGAVGNGGLSFRSRSKILSLLKIRKYAGGIAEDIWYSEYLPLVGKIAPYQIAKTFAVETVFYENPFGVHKPQLNKTELEKLWNICPESKLIPFRVI